MNELMFGSASPMWTMASGNPGYQPIGPSSRPATPSMFNVGTQQNLAVPGVAVAYPFASNPAALLGADPTGLVPAPSLLAAVAMRRGQLQGPTNDQEVEEFIYDALDLIPGASDVEARCEAGRITLSGSVQHKRTKRDVGEIAWAIPGLHDVQNNISIAPRRRGRAAVREAEAPTPVSARKQG